MAGAAIVERQIFSVEGHNAVDAATVLVPAGEARPKYDALPFPCIQVRRRRQARGRYTFAGVEDVERGMRFAAGSGRGDRDAHDHLKEAVLFEYPWIFNTFQ